MIDHRKIKILIVAFPNQGHINPSLRFANRLVKMGVDVTFSTSFSVLRRLDMRTTHHGLSFAPFSDGHDNGKDPTTILHQYISDIASNGASSVAESISSVAAAGQPFDHLVYTTIVPWAAKVANAHGLKSTLLWCQPATTLDIYYYYFNGYESLISSNSKQSAFSINLPGLPPLTTVDIPSFLLSSCPKEHLFVRKIMKDHIDALKISPRILINTFNELEMESIRAIEKIEFIPIGPLVPSELLEGKEPSNNFEGSANDCIQWLNTKPKSSVVYVSFGTMATLSIDQLEEIATGLVESQRPFLWVIRDGEQGKTLSKIEKLQKQGMIVGWCPQVEVLGHEAIGCFLTHCGWNSTVEALAAGIPLLAFPQWSDQKTNAKMIEDVWKTGVRMKMRERDGLVEGEEIEKCVEMIMGDEQIRRNAEKWRELAREALNNGGSSTINLQAFLDDA